MMLMLIAPLLNAGCEKLVEKSIEKAWHVWGLFALGVTLNWLPNNAYTGLSVSGGGSHTILMMIFMYVTARILALSKVEIRPRYLLCGVAFFIAGIVVVAIPAMVKALIARQPITAIFFWGHSTYDAPHLWIMAMTVLLFFVYYVKLPYFADEFFCFIAPSTFGIYLFHEGTHHCKVFYAALENKIDNLLFFHPIINIILTGLLVYIIGLAIDMVRRGIVLAFTSRGSKNS